jgi:hypothetical protein
MRRHLLLLLLLQPPPPLLLLLPLPLLPLLLLPLLLLPLLPPAGLVGVALLALPPALVAACQRLLLLVQQPGRLHPIPQLPEGPLVKPGVRLAEPAGGGCRAEHWHRWRTP